MKKVNNLKVNFSKILKDHYSFKKDDIERFWENKEKEEKWENKRIMVSCASLGALSGSAIFAAVDGIAAGMDCSVAIAIAATVSALATGVSLIKKNPYSDNYIRAIEEEYKTEKEKSKKK